MSRNLSSLVARLLLVVSATALVVPAFAGDDRSMRVEARLVWGTDDKASPNPNHTPVSPDLARKLRKTFKWRNYFQVNCLHVNVDVQEVKPIRMSKHCVIEVKNLGKRRVEVKLVGDGKQVSTCSQPLREGEDLVLGGDAKNNTAWFVILRSTSKQADDDKPESDDDKKKAGEKKDSAFNLEERDFIVHYCQVQPCAAQPCLLSN